MRVRDITANIFVVLVIVTLFALVLYRPTSAMVGKPVIPLIVQQSFHVPDDMPIEGGKIDADTMRGKVVLIDFWATWCQPCIQSLPHLKKLHQDYADKGLRIISYTDSSSKNVPKFIRSYEITYMTVIGPGLSSVLAAYGVSSIPQVVLVDKKGIIRSMGHPSSLSSALIEELLAE